MKRNSDSFRMPFHTFFFSKKFMTNKSHLRLQLKFFNRRERQCHCNRFRCPNSSAFGLKQSSTSLNPIMMRAQEQNMLSTFNYCCLTAIPSVKLTKLIVESETMILACDSLQISTIPCANSTKRTVQSLSLSADLHQPICK